MKDKEEREKYAQVLIVPLWNWNEKLFENEVAWNSFNRTFMELKSTNVNRVHGSIVVLIVPLWNWNAPWGASAEGVKSFNRTFMELKWVYCWRTRDENVCFNRTFMELK